MKNHYILIIFVILIYTLTPFSVSALSGFIGLDLEGNMNTREKAAMAGGLSFGFDWEQNFTLGFRATYSNNLNTVSCVQPTVFFRYYPFIKSSGFFMQGELGAVLFFEYGDLFPAIQGGLAAGWRFNLGKTWYLEPSIRGGYPYIWGAGLTVGIRYDTIREGNKGEIK